ncbi:hypothetical protein [Flavobacterium sp.]|uniref:hypothetical protein n=1 Tax=Flavobacterium sp. TaxID=239 RepID=UPI003752B4C3
MVTVKIKENSKQAKLFLDYIKTLSFVEFVDSNSNIKTTIPTMDEIVAETRKSRTKIAKSYNAKK